ncbi:MAG: hypothetical protein ACPL5F_14975, partial [Moorellaceae bacterium]
CLFFFPVQDDHQLFSFHCSVSKGEYKNLPFVSSITRDAFCGQGRPSGPPVTSIFYYFVV